MLQAWTVVVMSAFTISVNSVLNLRPCNEMCSGLTISNQTTSGYLLWTRHLEFRHCFIKCYQDTRCGGFWYYPGGLCLGRSTEYFTDAEANNNNERFYNLCRAKVSSVCPVSRGYVYLEVSGMCVKFHHKIEIWKKSRSTCQTEGGDLVVLNTKLKHDSIQSYIAKLNIPFGRTGRRVWVGMSRLRNHDYKWVGHHHSWAKWTPGDPSYGSEQCCQTYRRGISDARCLDPRYFICELQDSA